MSEEEQKTERVDAIIKVVSEIKQRYEGKDWHGQVLCPICQGRLTVMHSGINDKTHGRCETDECLRWME